MLFHFSLNDAEYSQPKEKKPNHAQDANTASREPEEDNVGKKMEKMKGPMEKRKFACQILTETGIESTTVEKWRAILKKPSKEDQIGHAYAWLCRSYKDSVLGCAIPGLNSAVDSNSP
jgi:hypothetical protein